MRGKEVQGGDFQQQPQTTPGPLSVETNRIHGHPNKISQGIWPEVNSLNYKIWVSHVWVKTGENPIAWCMVY